MPAVVVSPSEEALTALVDQINSGGEYSLVVDATALDNIIDPLEEITELMVDVTEESAEHLTETLDVENRTTHIIRVWIRKKLYVTIEGEVNELKLLASQLFQRLNNFNSDDGRVKVWECEYDPKQVPDKAYLNQSNLFVSSILCRVEVEAS